MDSLIEKLKAELLSDRTKQSVFDNFFDDIEKMRSDGFTIKFIIEKINENKNIIGKGTFRSYLQRSKLKRKGIEKKVIIEDKNNLPTNQKKENDVLIGSSKYSKELNIKKIYPDIPDRQLKIVLRLIEENKLSIDELKIIKKTHRSSLLLQTKLNQLNK